MLNVGLEFAVYAVALILTIGDLVRTRDRARSAGSQTGWLFLVIFFPLVGVLLYWLGEARRRRRMGGKPSDPA